MLLYVGVLLIFGRLSWVAGRFTADTIEGIDSVWYTTEPIKDKDGGGGGWFLFATFSSLRIVEVNDDNDDAFDTGRLMIRDERLDVFTGVYLHIK